ncbi:hypothetical protein EV175_007119, partial [Coemansia sp. RSA 1933]
SNGLGSDSDIGIKTQIILALDRADADIRQTIPEQIMALMARDTAVSSPVLLVETKGLLVLGAGNPRNGNTVWIVTGSGSE